MPLALFAIELPITLDTAIAALIVAVALFYLVFIALLVLGVMFSAREETTEEEIAKECEYIVDRLRERNENKEL